MLSSLVLAAALASSTGTPGAPEPADIRAQMDALGGALERAVQKVARPSAWTGLPRGAWRSYRLQGYGALFVLSPRALPTRARAARTPQETQLSRAIAETMRGLEENLKREGSEVVRRQMEAALESLRQTQAQLVGAGQAAERSSREAVRLRDVQRIRERELRRQMDEMQRELEAFRREAERAREEAERHVVSRLALSPPPMPPVTPLAPSEPAPPPAAEAPPAAMAPPPPPAPPWEVLWLDREDSPGAHSSERLIQDVQSAVTAALQEHGAEVQGVRPEEFVVVAIDFIPRAAVGSGRPQKTLLVRVRKKALDDVRAGRLSEPAFRKRVESLEY